MIELVIPLIFAVASAFVTVLQLVLDLLLVTSGFALLVLVAMFFLQRSMLAVTILLAVLLGAVLLAGVFA